MNIKTLLCATAFITALALVYGLANATDTTPTERDWELLAKQNWIAEHGDIPPNLTQESEKYLEKMTTLLENEPWQE